MSKYMQCRCNTGSICIHLAIIIVPSRRRAYEIESLIGIVKVQTKPQVAKTSLGHPLHRYLQGPHSFIQIHMEQNISNPHKES